jgi:hypothetical protein
MLLAASTLGLTGCLPEQPPKPKTATGMPG